MSVKGFFAVDRRAWARACALGVNPAIVYLVLARGSGGDQRTSAWSINSVERYTGVSRPRAQAAFKSLIEAQLVRVTKEGTRPLYNLTPAHEVPGCEDGPLVLSPDEQHVRDLVAAGHCWVPKVGRYDSVWRGGNPYTIALSLGRKGVLRNLGGQNFEVASAKPNADEPDWIWLPNALVDGAAREVPPIERIRQLQDARALRLLVDLYYAHTLASDGGIHWRTIRHSYTREKLGEVGRFVLWRFEEHQDLLWWTGPFASLWSAKQTEDGNDENGPLAWELWNALKGAGLVECVPHLIEADTAEAEVVHPCPLNTGTPAEQALGYAAREAAEALANPVTLARLAESGGDLIPVPDRIQHVQMVGIYRLRYRPHTTATKAWFAREEEWKRMAEGYRTLALEAAACQPARTFPTALQHQG